MHLAKLNDLSHVSSLDLFNKARFDGTLVVREGLIIHGYFLG